MGLIKKVCSNCYERKKLAEFRTDERYFMGVKSSCKKCEQLYTKNWRLKNPDKNKKHSYSQNRTIKARYNLLKIRNKKFTNLGQMSLSEYENCLHKAKCTYCSAKMPATGVGLDRINNKIGYVISNVVTCCGRCNVFRGIGISYQNMLKLRPLLKKIQKKISQLKIEGQR